MLIIPITIILSFHAIYIYGQNVPYNGTCIFTHDCADWREGRVICDETKRCTCRQTQNISQGMVFWDNTNHRCIYCPDKWFQREARCYYFNNVKLSWLNARHKCQSDYKSDLLVFDSSKDLDWFRKYGIEMSTEYIPAFGGTEDSRRFWIGAMNEPFEMYGQFSWIDPRGFQFDGTSSMWCRPNSNGVPAAYDLQPSWNQSGINETRVSLVRWKNLRPNNQSVFCLNDDRPDELLSAICERTSTTFKTQCDINKNICQNNGVCTAVTENDPALCDCTETPYSGATCSNNCGHLSSHCLNGGNCTKSGNCICTSLWEDPVCFKAKDPCLSNPCQYNSKCSQLGNTPNFFCDCDESGWTGHICNITKYPCPADRCRNNAQCKAVGRDNFTCNCLKTGYQGTFCERGCLSTNKPCENSGSCIDNKCVCDALRTGDFCQFMSNKNSTSSPTKDRKFSLTTWLILLILLIVSTTLIIGLIYSRQKLAKERQQRRKSIHQETTNRIEANENDAISIAPSEISGVTKMSKETHLSNQSGQ